jgi:SAM-dependent methyltransferase
MAEEPAEYDAIGDRYSEAKTAPWRVHLEAYTLEQLAGDVSGARVLDLACGDGFYSRRLMRLGAAQTLGVDASAEMIALGERAERAAACGCRYLHADVMNLGVVGQFDLVVAAFLLNYARSRDELRRFAEVMYANTRPGGRLIGVNDYTDDGQTGTRHFERHGFRKSGPARYSEGEPITYEILLPAGRSFAITNFYWHPRTYLDVLEEAGFDHPQWHPFVLSPEGLGSLPTDAWDEMLRAPQPMSALTAQRSSAVRG